MIVATSPVNPVKEQGLLTIHCQVRNLNDDHQVTITRRIGDKIQQMSVNEDVLGNAVDERVFLAVRQLLDGSTVYFLSVMHATKEDEGQYTCKVEKPGFITDEIIGFDSVDIQIMTFPSKSSPLCNLVSGSLKVLSGEPVTFNCSSELTNPPVEILWSKSGSKKSFKTNQVHTSERTYAEFHFIPSLQDDGDMFICTITSDEFPLMIQTCHIGPLSVGYNPNGKPHRTLPTEDTMQENVPKKHPDNSLVSPTWDRSKCQETCSLITSDNFFWILTFSIAGFLAFLFLVIGILLSIKYYRTRRSLNITAQSLNRYPVDDMYSELDIKPVRDGRVYMTLELREKLKNAVHYQETPNNENY